MKKHIAIIVGVGILGLCRSSYGMRGERIGPDTRHPRHPTLAQRDWPKGIVGIPRHMSRVYSIWVGGINENFYFKCKVDEINELLAIFSKSRMRDHVVRIEPGVKKASTFAKEEIEYNVRLQIVAGLVLSSAREKPRDDLPLEPRLTILTGDDDSLVNQLKWPRNVIVESEIPGVAINKDRQKPKRNVYYGLCEFADGSPPVEFAREVNSRITLWEQAEPNGINLGRIDNEGYCRLLFSDAELADLRKGKTWLTITIGNWLVKTAKTDMRFPAEMLTLERDKAQPIKVTPPSYYHGRLLFEDGSPAILDPPPWPGAEIHINIPYGGHTRIDSEGYFKVPMSKEQFEKAGATKPRRNIYIPDLIKRGRSRAEFTFPAHLLFPDKDKAGVLKIPRPKLPKKELATAESKIGKPIPGFNKIRFEAFPGDQIKDKRLLVCFWDMDQRPCRQCIQDLEKQAKALEDRNIVILAVHSGTKDENQVRQWLKENSISLTVGIIQGDPYDTLLAWGARSSPWLVLTDEKHVVTKAGFNLQAVKQTEEESK
jgi:hypothetical protein